MDHKDHKEIRDQKSLMDHKVKTETPLKSSMEIGGLAESIPEYKPEDRMEPLPKSEPTEIGGSMEQIQALKPMDKMERKDYPLTKFGLTPGTRVQNWTSM